MKSMMIFDLDGTLAESKSTLDPEMSALLGRLMNVARVAGDFQEATGLSSRSSC